MDCESRPEEGCILEKPHFIKQTGGGSGSMMPFPGTGGIDPEESSYLLPLKNKAPSTKRKRARKRSQKGGGKRKTVKQTGGRRRKRRKRSRIIKKSHIGGGRKKRRRRRRRPQAKKNLFGRGRSTAVHKRRSCAR